MFHDLKNLIFNAVQRAGISRQVEAANVVELFDRLAPELLGEAIAKGAKAAYVRNNILTIECVSSLIAQEVRYREQDIIKELNKKAGGQAVEKIRYIS
jgi:predicted nucleic acid-binding Zn ribbon protein